MLTKNGFIDARPFLIVHVEKENICDFKAFNILLYLKLHNFILGHKALLSWEAT